MKIIEVLVGFMLQELKHRLSNKAILNHTFLREILHS